MSNLCIERVASARVRAGLILSAALLAGAASASANGPADAPEPKAVAERLGDGGLLRVALEGGVPWSAAVLRLESGAGPVEQAVLLDGAGRWQREIEGFDPRAAVALSFRVQSEALSSSAVVAWHVFVPGLPQAGGLDILQGKPVISEFMKDPTAVADTAGEWFEIYNAGDFDVNLEGWAIADLGSNFHVISAGGAGLIVPPGGRVVLGNNANPALNGGVAVDYKYSSYTLGNAADQILLITPGGKLADGIAYDDGVLWPDTPGVAAALDALSHDPIANDSGAAWCNALTPQSPGNPDKGSPGERNAACP